MVEIICAKLVLGVVPQPCQLATGVLDLVVLLETVIGWQDFCGNYKFMPGRVQGPEICAENHDAEANVHVVVVLCHPFFELIGEILAKTHI